MSENEDNTIPPRPWRVRVVDGDCWNILDAEGESVVITDAGHYPPNIATAQFIVDLANKVPNE